MHISRERKLVTAEAVRRMEALIRYFEPPAMPSVSAKRLLQAASGDKKNRAGVRRFVLLQGLGNATVAEDVTDAEVLAGIESIRVSRAANSRGRVWSSTRRDRGRRQRGRRRPLDVRSDRPALRSAESCALLQHRPDLVAPGSPQLSPGAGSARGPGSGLLLRHRGHDAGAAAAPAKAWTSGAGRGFRPPDAAARAAKFASRGAIAFEADALHLPLAAGSLDLLTTAFGFRNLANYQAGLEEFYRTLKPGGELGILDFSEPGGVMGKLYAFYFRRVLPAVGRCSRESPDPTVIFPARSAVSYSSTIAGNHANR